MSAACAPARTAVYRRRRPERTVLYRTVQTHLATRLALSCDSRQGASGPAHVEREFRRHLECGILAHGFARARCTECGHDFLIAWSCKGRGVCPACNTRRMVETAAHLADHGFPATFHESRVPDQSRKSSPTGSGVSPGWASAWPAA